MSEVMKAIIIVWLILLTFFALNTFSEFHFVTPPLYEVAKKENAADALHLAVQVGRLDIVTLFLAIIAFIGFWSYGHVVDRAARKETKEIAPEVISKILRDEPSLWLKVIRDNPSTFESVIKEATEGRNENTSFGDGELGDAIAEIVDKEEVNNENS